MLFFKELFLAVRCFFKSLDYINQHKLWKYFTVPAIINLIIFIGIGFLAFHYSGQLIDYLEQAMEVESDTTLNTIIQFFLAILIRIMVIFVYLKLYRYTVLILMAPVLAVMADKLHAIEQKSESSAFNLTRTVKDAVRGARIAVVNIARELLLTIIILIFAIFIPLLSPFAPILIFFIESYYYGFSMIDYFNELQKLSAKESRQMIWAHKGLALGNGAMFNLLLLVPVVGVMTAPLLALTASHIAMQKNNDDTRSN